jgi:hypothetical protein
MIFWHGVPHAKEMSSSEGQLADYLEMLHPDCIWGLVEHINLYAHQGVSMCKHV